MDTNIFIGIAVAFLGVFLNVGAVLVVFKLLHWVFEFEDRDWKKRIRNKYGID